MGRLKKISILIYSFFVFVNIANSQTIINEGKNGEYYLSDSTVNFNKKRNGSKDGWWKFNYFFGGVKEVAFYNNGKKNGKSITFYRNGDLKSVGRYSDGKKDGVFIFYDKRSVFPFRNKVKTDVKFVRYLFLEGENIEKLPPEGHQKF
jgi:antitoxin component YwqK of YwqJK toxin-antitoxin module